MNQTDSLEMPSGESEGSEENNQNVNVHDFSHIKSTDTPNDSLEKEAPHNFFTLTQRSKGDNALS
jgi:hypothetical protein